MKPLIVDTDDATLVRQTLAGHREAFTSLLNRYYSSVLQLCRRLLHSPWEAEDIAQEAAIQALLGLPRLEEPARFGAWFHAIAANLARKAMRRHRTASLDDLPEGIDFAMMWSEAAPPPEEALAAREFHDAIVTALNDLSEVNHDAVIGYYFAGYDQKELAKLLNVPISTIRGRLFQGRQQLRATLSSLVETIQERPRRKEVTVNQPELVQVKRARFLFPFVLDGWTSHTVIELRAIDSAWAFPLRVNPAEGDILWKLPTDKTAEQVIDAEVSPILQDWTFSMMKTLGIQLKRIVIERLVDTIYYATVTLAQGQQVKEVEIRPGEALILAAYTDIPIFAARQILESVGYNWEEFLTYLNIPRDQREHDTPAHQELRQRILSRVEQYGVVGQAIPLTSKIKQQLAMLLKNLIAESKGRTAFIVDHQTGSVVAWAGVANEQDMKLFARVLALSASSLHDLRDLLRYTHFLIGEIAQGNLMPFAQVSLRWQLFLVVPRALADAANPVRQPYYERAISELEQIVKQVEGSTDSRA